MRTRRLVLTALLLAALAAVSAWADSQARIVRLSLVNGSVQIDRALGQGFEKAIANMPITQGMKLRTDDASRAEVEFENGTTLRLVAGGTVEFPELSLRADGERLSTVRVETGTVYMNVRHKKQDDFRLQLAGRELTFDRSVRFRLKVDQDEAQFAVFKGELAIGGVRPVKAKKNETLALDLRDQDKFELAKGISPDAFDTWDANRVEYQEYYTASNYGNSPYSYGRSDLNYYGRWSNVPGYGNLWQPFGVSYGWEPFSNGYWAWYPGFGYTFVSGYPWGWTPYRYGSWVFLGGQGWCWRPGGWNSWHTLPPVFNPPADFSHPQPPANTFAGGGAAPPPTVATAPAPYWKSRNSDGELPPRRHRGPTPEGTAAAGGNASVPTSNAGTATTVRTPSSGSAKAPGTTTSRRGGDDSVNSGRPMRSHGERPMRGDAVHERPSSAPRNAAPSSGPTPRASAPASSPAPRVSAPSSSAGAPHSSSSGKGRPRD